MSHRFCSHCGARIDDRDARRCVLCGHELQPESDEPRQPPAPPQAPEPDGAPPPGSHAPPAPSVPPSVPVASAGAHIPADGQRRCPHCGEALYSGERVCWHCKRRVDLFEAVAGEDTGTVTQPLPGAPGPVPSAPSEQAPPAASRVRPVAAPPPVQAPAGPEAPPDAMATAWWAFGLGLVSVFTCGLLGLLGPVAIWLGISANRRGAGPVAIAGIVFGALGTLVILAFAIALLIGMLMSAQMVPSHVLLPTLEWSVVLCAAPC